MIRKLKNLKKEHKIIIYTLLGVVLLFFLWWGLSAIIKSTLFPSPIDVIPQFFIYLGNSKTYIALGWTLLRLLISFAISFILGCILGILAGNFYRVDAILRPLVEFLRTIPTAAVVLLLVILIKPKWTPVIVTSLVMFPLFYQAFNSGIKSINENVKDEMKIDNATLLNSLFKLYIPLIWPYVLLSIIQSLGLGMKVSIMSEVLAGSSTVVGLGRLIQNEASLANATNVMAYSLIAIVIIAIADIIFINLKRIFKNNGRKDS